MKTLLYSIKTEHFVVVPIGAILANSAIFLPVNIELKSRKAYYASLQAYEREGNLRPSIELILKSYDRLKKNFEGI